jgi:hypothetical protein
MAFSPLGQFTREKLSGLPVRKESQTGPTVKSDPFDLVNEYARLRSSFGDLGALPEPEPLEVQQPLLLKSAGSKGLVSWSFNGPTKQIDGAVLPYFQAMVRQFPGLSFSSGYRDPEHNRRVGGVPNSWHLRGRAGDFVGPMNIMRTAQAWARANGAREALIHNAGSGLHLHVAW